MADTDTAPTTSNSNTVSTASPSSSPTANNAPSSADSRREKNLRKDFPCTYSNCGKVFHRRTCLTNHLKAHLNPHSRSIRRNARAKRYGLKKPANSPLNSLPKQLLLARYVVKRDNDTILTTNPSSPIPLVRRVAPAPTHTPTAAVAAAAAAVNDTCASLALLANTAVNVASLAPLHVPPPQPPPPPPPPSLHSRRPQTHTVHQYYSNTTAIPLLPCSPTRTSQAVRLRPQPQAQRSQTALVVLRTSNIGVGQSLAVAQPIAPSQSHSNPQVSSTAAAAAAAANASVMQSQTQQQISLAKPIAPSRPHVVAAALSQAVRVVPALPVPTVAVSQASRTQQIQGRGSGTNLSVIPPLKKRLARQ